MSRRFAAFPFSPARWPFFYGWWIVVASVVGVVASIPGQTMGVGVFIEPLMKALEVERTTLTRSYMAGTILSGCVLPIAGRCFDRWGARVLGSMAAVGLGLTLVALSEIDRLVTHSREVGAAIGITPGLLAGGILSAAFFLVRFWGQGVLTMVSRAMIGKWFDRHRGIASGLSGVFAAAAFSSSPMLLAALIASYGWRATWQLLAVVIGGAVAVFIAMFFRDNPEECGLRMDGVAEPGQEGEDGHGSASRELHYTLGEALSTYAFWIVNASIALQALIFTAFTFHIVRYGDTVGMQPQDVVRVFLPMAVVSTISNILGGWFSDRVRVRTVLLIQIIAMGGGTLALLPASFENPLGWWTAVTGVGVAGGLFHVLVTVTWPRFFGRAHLGAISSVNFSTMVFASALGPHLFALVEREQGNFDLALIACAAASAVCLILALPVKNPCRRAANS